MNRNDDAPSSTRDNSTAYPRLALTAVLGLYGIACFRHPETGGLLDGVDLAIHETGHLVFAPFGEVLQFAGGTLFQLIVPCAFLIYFLRRGDRHAATVPLWWIAQNFWNISVYVKDARAMELPLVGGGEHDWNFLLGRFGVLPHDQGIGQAIHAIGMLLYLLAIAYGIVAALAPRPAAEEPDAQEPVFTTTR